MVKSESFFWRKSAGFLYSSRTWTSREANGQPSEPREGSIAAACHRRGRAKATRRGKSSNMIALLEILAI